jgi:PEGA domain
VRHPFATALALILAATGCSSRDAAAPAAGAGGASEQDIKDMRAELADVRAELRSIRAEMRAMRGGEAGEAGEAGAPADQAAAGRDAGPGGAAAAAGKPAAPGAAGKPPAPARISHIALDSNPAGATVYVGDKKMGVTPIVLESPSGSEELRLRIEKSGYRPRLMTVRPDEETKLSVQLAKAGK